MKNKPLFFTFFLLISAFAAQSQVVKLNSYPVASATIYLDFDGEEVNSPVWNNGNTINCIPPGLNNTQITEIFNRVSEDYRPFDINITTDLDVYIAAPVDKRMRVIITPTSSWFSNAGGVSYLGSFKWGDETPCFVFSDRLGPNNLKMVAECCSHESGHTLGLSHQSKYDAACQLTATYNEGAGTGETGWAPIMGNSYYRNMSGWNNGPTPYGCANHQDNLSIITTQNGFGYRADDHSDDMDISPTVINLSGNNADGIISTTNDKDVFTFSLSRNANFHLEAMPYSVGNNNSGADLDIKLSLYNASKNLIRVYDPSESMGVVIDSILVAGKYFIVVEGTGNTNASDYGSLGSYKLTSLYTVLPICDVTLRGNVNKNMHQFNWSVNCDENISSVVLQSSPDGIHFVNVSNLVNQNSFSYIPMQQSGLYYRLQVTSSSGNTVYSAVLLLKQTSNSQPFTVTAVTNNDITVIAKDKFEYTLATDNGSIISRGTGNGGSNTISTSGKPAGVYILYLSGSNGRQTERVLKL